MQTCQTCREQILDHLYGLLEPEEEQTFQLHILQCSECASQLAQERRLQAVIGAAAKVHFPEVKFVAPQEKLSQESTATQDIAMQAITTVASAPVTAKPSRRWMGWAIAASLFLVAGLGVLIPYQLQESQIRALAQKESASEIAVAARLAFLNQVEKERQAKIESVSGDSNKAKNKQAFLEEEWRLAQQQAINDLNRKELEVRLLGPDRPQPGASNQWQVQTLDKAGRYQPARFDVIIRDQADQVVYQQGYDKPVSPPLFDLPVDVWAKLKPDTQLYMDVVHRDAVGAAGRLCERVPLAGSVLTTQLATDKPMYQPGETVHFRTVTLDRTTLIPPSRDLDLQFMLTKPDNSQQVIQASTTKLVTEEGKLILGPDHQPLRGVAAGEFPLPAETPGGEYVLTVSEVTPGSRNLVEMSRRKFNVNRYTPDKFFKKLEFDGKTYGPGDFVQVASEASRTEGVLKNKPVSIEVRVDGKPIEFAKPGSTNEEGKVRFAFRLPKEINSGEGSVSINYRDQDAAESIVRPIPILGKTISVEFFPEGGDLIAGLTNRVYFQAKTPSGKPADLKGFLTDGKQIITELQTLTDPEQPGASRGQGAFSFTPEAGKSYYLSIRTPYHLEPPTIAEPTTLEVDGKKVNRGFKLPLAKTEGIVLKTEAGVTNSSEPIQLQLQSTRKSRLLIGAYVRGTLVDNQEVMLEPKTATPVTLKPGSTLGGVTRITVFEQLTENGKVLLRPQAERLTYRQGAQNLQLVGTPNLQRYTPNSPVELKVSAKKEAGTSTGAVVMVGVINQSVVTMADMKTDRSLPSHLLLAPEIEKPEDLEHADFLLGNHPLAKQAIDLLLGTQGWRRFAEQSVQLGKAAPRPEVERLLRSSGQTALSMRDSADLALKPINDKYQVKYEQVIEEVVLAQDIVEQVQADPAIQSKISEAQSAYQAALVAKQLAADQLRREKMRVDQVRENAIPYFVGSGCLLGLFVCVYSLINFFRGGSWFSLIVGLFLLAIGGVGAIEWFGDDAKSTFTGVKSNALATAEDRMTPMAAARPRLEPLAEKEERAEEPRAVELFADNMPAPPKPAANAAPSPEAPPLAELQKNKLDDLAGRQFKEMDAEKQVADKNLEQARKLDEKRAKQAQIANRFRGALNKDLPASGPAAGGAGLGGPGMGKGGGGFGGGFGGMPGGGFGGMPGGPGGMPGAPAPARFFEGMARRNIIRPLQAGQEKYFGMLADRQGLEREQEEMKKRGAARPMLGLKPQMAGEPQGQIQFLKQERDLDRKQLADAPIQPIEEALVDFTPSFVREFAFRPAREDNPLRDDFAETVYWHPALVLPNDKGEATIKFSLAGDIAKYQVIIAGHTLDGWIGATTMQLEARKPFSLDPKFPQEVSNRDRIDLPVRVINDSPEARVVKYQMQVSQFDIVGPKQPDQSRFEGKFSLVPDQKDRQGVSLQPKIRSGLGSVRIVGMSEPVAPIDAIERTVRIVPEGFPVNGASSDLIERKLTKKLNLPGEILPGSLELKVHMYPSTLADLQQGLDGLLREPNGCFEQTSTSNYPNTLILDYLQSSNQTNPAAAKRARDLLDQGYEKLTGFECQLPAGNGRQGYEWFGGTAPPHEALTAYGLLQFRDMSKVRQVDPAMLERTRTYLISSKDDVTGGFKRNARALDSFGGAPEHITNAYIVWAITESDEQKAEFRSLTKQIERLIRESEEAGKKTDSYFVALVANALLNTGDATYRTKGLDLLTKLIAQQQEDGSVVGATTSITRSGGRDLLIETTGLTVLGWLKAAQPDRYQLAVQKAVKWIGQQRGGYGGFGSTQSTILALKALIGWTKLNAHPAEDGELTITIAGKETKQFKKPFTKADREVITLNIENAETLLAGNPEITLELNTKHSYPVSIAWNAMTRLPNSDPKCAIDLKTTLNKSEVKEGETVSLNMNLMNKLKTDHGMTVAILGIPGGMKLPTDFKQLTRLREEGKISYFEVKGRELVLYWRFLKPEQKIDLDIDLIADVPGQYQGPASRAYLYYNADPKVWVKPVEIAIKPE
jgi:hypothetical protein